MPCSGNTSAAAASARDCSSTKAAPTRRSASPEAPLIFAFSPLVGSPLTTSAKFAVVSRSPLTERFNDSLASSGSPLPASAAAATPSSSSAARRSWSVLVVDDGEVRLEPADESSATPCHVAEEKLRARLGAGLPHRLDRPGRRARRALRHDLARRTSRRPRRQRRRPRQQEHQGDRGARDAALRVGAAARADRVEPRSVEAIVRSGDREVPRAGNGDEPADVQSLRHAADAQLPERHVRGGARICRPSS